MERRHTSQAKSSELPVDYVKMVHEVFSTHFDEPLKLYREMKADPSFSIRGEIYSDEIVLAVSLQESSKISAITVYASCDFDPKASSPTIQDLLSACVDAIGNVFGLFFTAEKPDLIEKIATDQPLSEFENIPVFWTAVDVNKKQVFVKLDKSNPKLDQLADEWLKKNDPHSIEVEQTEQKETEDLFFTGPKDSKKTH